MKRTIVKFGAAVLMMCMCVLMPSCKGEKAESEIDQYNPLKSNNPDDLGKFWFKILKNGNKEKFNTYIIQPAYDQGIYGTSNSMEGDIWDLTRKFNGDLFQWENTEYTKCVIDREQNPNEYQKQFDEFYLTIYFKNSTNNQEFSIGLLFTKELNTQKYFLKPMWDPQFRFLMAKNWSPRIIRVRQ